MIYSIDDTVTLNTFFGDTTPSEDVIDEKENYWKLIGVSGKIIQIKENLHPAFPEKGKQVLVKFDINLEKLNLISHNNVENSLWIFESDLIKN